MFCLCNVLRPPFCILLVTLGGWVWNMKMRLSWNKSQKTLDTVYEKIASKWAMKRQECWKTEGLIPSFILGTANSVMDRIVTPWRDLGEDEIHIHGHHLPHDCWLCRVPSPRTMYPFYAGETNDNLSRTTLQAPLMHVTTCRVRGVYYYQYLPRVPCLCGPRSGSRVYF